MSGWATLLEHLLNTVIADGNEFFPQKARKDHEGFTVLTVPKSYYGLTVIVVVLALMFLYFAVFVFPPEDYPLALISIVVLMRLAVLSLMYVRNTTYRFNHMVIIRQNLFKEQKYILWSESNFKPVNPFSQSLTIYNTDAKFRIHIKLVGFGLLADFIEKKFNLSRKEMRIPGSIS